MSEDLALLRQYEPVICYTLGELYFPCAVDEYVRRSSLWLRPPQGTPIQLHESGALTLDKLATYSDIPDGLQGLGIAFITAGLLSLGFMGIAGIKI